MSLDKNRKIHIVDTTLRDGSHAVSHSYTVEQVTAIASGLDKVGVDIIELSHGDGLAGSSINYGFSATPEMELIRAASQVVRRARLGVLLLPGVGTIEDLKGGQGQWGTGRACGYPCDRSGHCHPTSEGRPRARHDAGRLFDDGPYGASGKDTGTGTDFCGRRR